jgi:heme-degrading monooxygenase HmoA
MCNSPVILVVGTDCSEPGKEEEFSRWYDETHIPEVLRVPGMLGATRFEGLDGGGDYPRFLVIYQMESEEAVRAFKMHLKRQRAGEAPDFTWGPRFEVRWWKAYRRAASH